MSFDALKRTLKITLESAVSQDRERIALAKADGSDLLLMRLIGPDGRNVDGLPNPWIAAQGENGSLPFYMVDMVAYAAKRGAAAVIISGPTFPDSEPGSLTDMIAVKLAAKSFVSSFNAAGIAVLAVQAGETITSDPCLADDVPASEMHGLASFFSAEFTTPADELPTSADTAEMLGLPDFGLDLGRSMPEGDE